MGDRKVEMVKKRMSGDRRVAVSGGRDYQDQDEVFLVLDALHGLRRISHLILGGAVGVDSHAQCWAIERRVSHTVYYADWDGWGNQAGPLRNRKMIIEGKPDICVLFSGGRGTGNMRKQCRKFGIEIIEIV